MKTLLILLSLFALSASVAAFDFGGGGGSDETPGQEQEQGQDQGQLQGQGQGQDQSQQTTNNNDSSARSGSLSAAGAISGALSGSDSSASNTATTGSQGQNTDITIEGDQYPDIPVNTAARAIGGACTDGASGQSASMGGALSRANPVCEQLMMSRACAEAGDTPCAQRHLASASKIANIRGFFRTFVTVITLGIL
jgi:hypothetical protein